MKIIVLVKEVPDTWGDRVIDLETGIADRSASDRVVDEISERAVELAVTLKEAEPDTEVVLLSAGPETVPASLRKGLAMGGTRAVHVLDDRMAGADLSLTAEVLAAAVVQEGFDLVITGDASTDGKGGVLPAMLAERAGVAHLSSLSSVRVADGRVRGERVSDRGTAEVVSALPAIVSITERLPDPRYPSFKGIMAAKKLPLRTLTLDDLGVDAGADVPRSIMLSVARTPSRSAGQKLVDEGDAGTRIAAFLVENRLV